MNWQKKIAVLLLFCTFCAAQASIVITGTRVVYPGGQKSIGIKLHNRGNAPSLVQAWLSPADRPEAADAPTPFVITPPVSRINPDKEQTLRVRHTGEPLPQDRETLFYLNVLDIPPKPKRAEDAASQNYLQFTIRSRLKFFYRPAKLPYPVQDAYAKVRWQAEGKTLKVVNPTPYFITYSDAAVKQGDTFYRTADAAMIAPFSEQVWHLDKVLPSGAAEVHWQIVNDYGGYYSHKTALP